MGKRFEIKHRDTGAVLWEGIAVTFRAAVEAAVGAKADLRGANLRYTDLRNADLQSANLREADLFGANLIDTNMQYADLRGADLHVAVMIGSDMQYADLRGADLRGVNLRGANLCRANLYGATLLCLPVGDPRGYRPVAIWRDAWRIVSGCRDFSVAEAREHWGENYKGDPAIGAQYVAACDWLESQPLPAWAVDKQEETE